VPAPRGSFDPAEKDRIAHPTGRGGGETDRAAPTGELPGDEWILQEEEADGYTFWSGKKPGARVCRGMSKVDVACLLDSARAPRRRYGWGIQTRTPGHPEADVWHVACGSTGNARPSFWVRLAFKDDKLVSIGRYLHFFRVYALVFWLDGALAGGDALGITRDDWQRSPKWADPESSEPPLSIQSAVAASRKTLSLLSAKPSEWILAGLELHSWVASRHYVVVWRMRAGGRDRRTIQVPVLLSGEAGAVIRVPKTIINAAQSSPESPGISRTGNRHEKPYTAGVGSVGLNVLSGNSK
jgi:hypothetical protein